MRAAQLQLGVRHFLRWWWDGLVACFPQTAGGGWFSGAPQLLLAVDGPVLVASLKRHDAGRELLRVTLGDSGHGPARQELAASLPARYRTLLELGAEQALTTTLQLPAVTDAELRQLVSHQIDHVSPFRRDQVHYGYRQLAGGAAAGGGQQLELTLVPKAAVAEALDTARSLGLTVEALRVPGGTEVALPAAESVMQRRCRRLNPLLAGVLALLLVAIAVLPLWGQQRQLTRLQLAVDAQAAQAQQVSQRRLQLQRHSEEAGMLFQRRRQAGSVLALLTALSRQLDDGTWLQRLEMRAGSLQLQGVSNAAVTVLATLEQLPFLTGVHFTGPITRTSDGSESFRLSARVESAGEP